MITYAAIGWGRAQKVLSGCIDSFVDTCTMVLKEEGPIRDNSNTEYFLSYGELHLRCQSSRDRFGEKEELPKMSRRIHLILEWLLSTVNELLIFNFREPMG